VPSLVSEVLQNETIRFSRANFFSNKARAFFTTKEIGVLATLGQFGVRIRHPWSELENS
jgi:hypothetical protein